MLEKRLGFKSDKKRRDRNNKQTEMEGFGMGFMDYLDNLNRKVKMDVSKYSQPEEYDFLKDENEVAMSEGELGVMMQG